MDLITKFFAKEEMQFNKSVEKIPTTRLKY